MMSLKLYRLPCDTLNVGSSFETEVYFEFLGSVIRFINSNIPELVLKQNCSGVDVLSVR